jgi:MFS family permease
MGQALATKFGDSQNASWIVPGYTVSIAISQMLCGGNSDVSDSRAISVCEDKTLNHSMAQLFGRRWFLIGGNVICLIGYIVAATSDTTSQLIAAMVLLGYGGGLCGLPLS